MAAHAATGICTCTFSIWLAGACVYLWWVWETTRANHDYTHKRWHPHTHVGVWGLGDEWGAGVKLCVGSCRTGRTGRVGKCTRSLVTVDFSPSPQNHCQVKPMKDDTLSFQLFPWHNRCAVHVTCTCTCRCTCTLTLSSVFLDNTAVRLKVYSRF